MNRLQGQNILLGVTGGIAAYKSAELTRRLRDTGADVRVVMTQAATEFVTPLTFQALSGHPVHTELLDAEIEAGMGHIELARWADAILIAPTSANFIAKLAQGRADDLLSTLCLASNAKLAFAPAMNRVMWDDLATQSNCKTLRQRGYLQLGPDSGEQACGETGEGRMMDVPTLIEKLSEVFVSGTLQGLHVLITAGPTYEAIDPVRYIGNRSSGRMGYALAAAAREAGARVTLISGPCHLPAPEKVTCYNVESADDMHEAVFSNIDDSDIFIAAAAVADYKPLIQHDHKLKKEHATLSLQLERNRDILADAARLPDPPFMVGFAAETEQLKQNAKEKLQRKHLDIIAANLVGKSKEDHQDIGFNSAYNTLEVYWHDGHTKLDLERKEVIARQLVEIIAEHYNLKYHNKTNRTETNEKDTA